MLRSVLVRSATLPRSAACARIRIVSSRVALQLVRYESSKVPDEKKKQLEAQNVLLRDWDAKIITYDELKPKTLQPSPVSFLQVSQQQDPVSDRSQDKYLIDVREPDEVLQGSIPSAVNLPLSVISTALHLPPAEFKEKYGFEKPRQDQELTFYCRSGVRSASAADVAKRNGYTKCVMGCVLSPCTRLNALSASSTIRALGWTGLGGKERTLLDRVSRDCLCDFGLRRRSGYTSHPLQFIMYITMTGTARYSHESSRVRTMQNATLVHSISM